jgi:hypothetical protein
MSPYEYRQINYEDEIRILVLAPSGARDRVHCDLEHIRLSTSPKFEALSYCWGSDSKPKDVLCKGDVIKVTDSLFSALRHLAFPNQERRIWADAVCIDQKNEEEKSLQVSIMGQIFSAACRTVVWLGEDENGREAAINHVDEIRACGELYYSLEDITKAIAPIFQSQWFHRLWVVREVALAEQVEFVIGRSTVRMDTLLEVLPRELWQYQHLFDARAVVNLQNIHQIRQRVRQGRTSAGYPNILELIRLTEWFDMTNKKDRIYALYGLTGVVDFTVDYRPCYSYQEMFVDFAAWSLRTFPDLALLSYTRGVGGKCLCAVPSWAPCYDLDGLPVSLLKIGHFKAFGHPTKRTDSTSPGGFEIYEKRNLRMNGAFISTVSEVCGATLNCAMPE